MAKKKADNAAVNAQPESSKGKEKAAVLNDDKPAKKTQKTNSQKKQTGEKPNIFKRMGKGIKGVISELKKVTWPKGKDVVKNTAVVLVVVVAFFLVLFVIDYVLSGILSLVVTGDWIPFIS